MPKRCFDNINQQALLKKLNNTPTLKRIIKGWLKAGVMENRIFQPTKSGTIQGRKISPLLACIALHGLEIYLKETMADELVIYKKMRHVRSYTEKAKISLSVTVYADDFTVLHESEEIVLKIFIFILLILSNKIQSRAYKIEKKYETAFCPKSF